MADPAISTILPATTAPGAADLWDMPHQLMADWSVPVGLKCSFSTDVQLSQSVAEDRRALVNKPYRTLTAQLTGLRQGIAQRILFGAARHGMARSLTPLYCDETALRTGGTAGDTIISLNDAVADRRFFVGARLLLGVPTRSMLLESCLVRTIAAINNGANQITLTAGLPADVVAGARVYPLIEARVVLEQSFNTSSDRIIQGSPAFLETEGRTALPALQAPGTTPEGMDSFEGLPIFDFPVEWGGVTQGTHHEGDYVNMGRGVSLYVYGWRPRFTYHVPLVFLRRAEAMRCVRFFESRQGRARPFWLLDPLDMFTPLSIGVVSISLSSIGADYDWSLLTHIGLHLTDGTKVVREIASVTTTDDGADLTMTDNFPDLNLSDIRRVTAARKVRLNSDEMDESWTTPTIMHTAFDMIEVILEQDVTLGTEGVSSGNAASVAFQTVDGCCEVPSGLDPITPPPGGEGSGGGSGGGGDGPPNPPPPPVPPVASSIRYDLCNPGQALGSQLSWFYAVGADPGLAIERIGGACYYRVGLVTGIAPSDPPPPPGSSVANCNACLTYHYVFCSGPDGSPLDIYYSNDPGLTEIKEGEACYRFVGLTSNVLPTYTDYLGGSTYTCAACSTNAVHYALCPTVTDALVDVYIPIASDPGAAAIKWSNGKCYNRVGTTHSDTFTSGSVSSTFVSCAACEPAPCSCPDRATLPTTLTLTYHVKTEQMADTGCSEPPDHTLYEYDATVHLALDPTGCTYSKTGTDTTSPSDPYSTWPTGSEVITDFSGPCKWVAHVGMWFAGVGGFLGNADLSSGKSDGSTPVGVYPNIIFCGTSFGGGFRTTISSISIVTP